LQNEDWLKPLGGGIFERKTEKRIGGGKGGGNVPHTNAKARIELRKLINFWKGGRA